MSSALMGRGERGWRSATRANTGGPPALPPPVSVHWRKRKLAIQEQSAGTPTAFQAANPGTTGATWPSHDIAITDIVWCMA